MLNVQVLDFVGMSNDISIVVHVGNLETLLHINLNELDHASKETLLSIMQAHVNNMNAQVLINKLAN